MDCGASISISSITFGTYWSSDNRYIPNGYTINYSGDGINYTNAVTVTGNQNISPVHTIGQSGRYWRITITAVQSGQTACNIAGFQLIGAGIGAATNNLFWNSGGYNSTTINYTGGNTGIGTTTPQALLELSQNTGSGTYGDLLRINSVNGNTGNGGGILFTNNGDVLNLARIAGLDAGGWGGNLAFYTSPCTYYSPGGTLTERMRIANTGNVLIGKTTQTNTNYLLDVAGNIRANKLVVNTTGADFVFAKKYHLIPLNELEKYIQQNKHLPGIEPAREMNKGGVDVGKNETKLLQKIEELTLYMIDMKKEMEQTKKVMQNQINQLKKQNRQLQSADKVK
jgi:hypothetical protein